jgi:hypothetical protein
LRIQIGRKILGTSLAASTLFVRKWVINVYMKHYEQTDYACDAEIHPYLCPTKRLKHLQELSHGWQRDLSSSLVLLPSFFSTLLMKMVGQLSKRGPTDGRDGAGGRLAKTSKRENKERW